MPNGLNLYVKSLTGSGPIAEVPKKRILIVRAMTACITATTIMRRRANLLSDAASTGYIFPVLTLALSAANRTHKKYPELMPPNPINTHLKIPTGIKHRRLRGIKILMAYP